MITLEITFQNTRDQIQIQIHSTLEQALEQFEGEIQYSSKYQLFETSNKEITIPLRKEMNIEQILKQLKQQNKIYVPLTIALKKQKMFISVKYQQQFTKIQIDQTQKCFQVLRKSKQHLKIPSLNNGKNHLMIYLILKNKKEVLIKDSLLLKDIIQKYKNDIDNKDIQFKIILMQKSISQSQRIDPEQQKFKEQMQNMAKSQIIIRSDTKPLNEHHDFSRKLQAAQINSSNLKYMQNKFEKKNNIQNKQQKKNQQPASKGKQLNNKQIKKQPTPKNKQQNKIQIKKQLTPKNKQQNKKQIKEQPTPKDNTLQNQNIFKRQQSKSISLYKPFQFQIQLLAEGYQYKNYDKSMTLYNANRTKVNQMLLQFIQQIKKTQLIQWETDDPYEIFYKERRFQQREKTINEAFSNDEIIKLTIKKLYLGA